MSRDTTDIANELLAENEKLKAELAELAQQEPVAYRRFVKDEHDRRLDCYEYFDFQGVGNKREPLFTRSAPPAPVKLPEIWFVPMKEGTDNFYRVDDVIEALKAAGVEVQP